jgi:hypothetical protein
VLLGQPGCVSGQWDRKLDGSVDKMWRHKWSTAWSPDGNWLMVASKRDGHQDIWLIGPLSPYMDRPHAPIEYFIPCQL